MQFFNTCALLVPAFSAILCNFSPYPLGKFARISSVFSALYRLIARFWASLVLFSEFCILFHHDTKIYPRIYSTTNYCRITVIFCALQSCVFCAWSISADSDTIGPQRTKATATRGAYSVAVPVDSPTPRPHVEPAQGQRRLSSVSTKSGTVPATMPQLYQNHPRIDVRRGGQSMASVNIDN